MVAKSVMRWLRLWGLAINVGLAQGVAPSDAIVVQPISHTPVVRDAGSCRHDIGEPSTCGPCYRRDLSLVPLAVVGYIAAAIFMYTLLLCRCGCLRTLRTSPVKKIKSTKTPLASKTKKTQSPTTFEWHRKSPQFRFLQSQGDHGCWSE